VLLATVQHTNTINIHCQLPIFNISTKCSEYSLSATNTPQQEINTTNKIKKKRCIRTNRVYFQFMCKKKTESNYCISFTDDHIFPAFAWLSSDRKTHLATCKYIPLITRHFINASVSPVHGLGLLCWSQDCSARLWIFGLFLWVPSNRSTTCQQNTKLNRLTRISYIQNDYNEPLFCTPWA
jgi:hypothetical protein